MSATSNSTTPHNHHHSQKTTIPKQQEKQLPNNQHHQQQQPQSPDITKEEFERISEALKKEEFRKLFLDYIEEIQDPENRKLYEEEIKQIEAERGVDVVFINPIPGFVIKTSQDGSQKCFINCAKSEHVAKPTNQICLDPKTGTRGLSWSIPMAQAPPRDDLDNANKRCRVYDVVFHPDALYLAERNSSFHKCLVETALDAVEREYKVNLDRINVKFPKLQFKGIARPTVIRKLAKDAPAEYSEPHPLENIYPAKPSINAGIPKILPLKTFDCSNSSNKNAIQPSDYCTPKYTLKHRHDVDLSEYTHELDAKLHVSTPLELVVDIELPLLSSSSECQLDVTEKTLFLLSERVGAKYRLNIDLPFRVKDKEGTAKFDVDTRHLLITMPVIRPSVENQRQMHESLLHLSREDSGVESDVRDELLSSNSESPVVEVLSFKMEQTSICRNDEPLNAGDSNDAENEEHFLHPQIDYQLPAKFDCNVLDNTMALVLHVRNVQEQSLQIKRHHNSLHLKFISVGSGYYPSYYSFYIQLSPEETEAKILTADAEAWENNVILNLHLNTSAECIASYLAGIDSDSMQEYAIQQKFKVSRKSRQRQKDQQQPSLDISIERSECEKAIEIEIKSRPVELSTCNANTTEDEDANSGTTDAQCGQQQPKKIGKKQKRKNKKRRSLSESACDDIKAYQQQQHHPLYQALIPTSVAEVNENKHEENAADADDDDEDDEDSSPDRTEKSLKSLHPTSMYMNVPLVKCGINNSINTEPNLQQRKQRSFSESRDSAISLSAGSSSYKGILKHYSRYDPRPSISDSCDSIEEFSSSVDGMPNTFNSLRFSHSFSDIPEENVVGLSESCKKTVRFSEVIKKQVFRLDSSILGQRKKNQKRRDRKQRALQRRLSEGDSADYEDNKSMAPLSTPTTNNQYLKSKNDEQYVAKNGCSNKYKTTDKKSNKMRARLESESSSDVDIHKNSMMFEMDM